MVSQKAGVVVGVLLNNECQRGICSFIQIQKDITVLQVLCSNCFRYTERYESNLSSTLYYYYLGSRKTFVLKYCI
jgi:hypothetical protein